MSGLDRATGFALIHECDSVKSLLDRAESTVEAVVNPDDLHPWLAVAAAGFERLIKITLGFSTLDSTGAWPDLATFRSAWGHKIVDIESTARLTIAAQVGRATAPGWIEQLLEAVTSDPWIDPLLALLDSFADQGRYEHVNASAGQPMASGPGVLFDALETDIFRTHPAYPDDLPELLRHRDDQLRSTIHKWRNLYAYALVHGVVGDEAKRFGFGFIQRDPT